MVKRTTQRQRLARKLKELRVAATRRRHDPMANQHAWLSQVLRGHYGYFGLPSNFQALDAFAFQARRIWFRSLWRRDGKRALNWERFNALLARFPLPIPRLPAPCRPGRKGLA